VLYKLALNLNFNTAIHKPLSPSYASIDVPTSSSLMEYQAASLQMMPFFSIIEINPVVFSRKQQNNAIINHF